MARPKLQKSVLSLKSWLFTPATKSDRFTRAADVHSDALIIDLQDAVAPSAKTEARETALRYLAGLSADRLPYVVTENGVANLKGLSSTERAQALIALAHPAFKEELTAAAKDTHLI